MTKGRSQEDPHAGPLLWSKRAAALQDPSLPGITAVPVYSDVLMLVTSGQQLVTSAARRHQSPEPENGGGVSWCSLHDETFFL